MVTIYIDNIEGDDLTGEPIPIPVPEGYIIKFYRTLQFAVDQNVSQNGLLHVIIQNRDNNNLDLTTLTNTNLSSILFEGIGDINIILKKTVQDALKIGSIFFVNCNCEILDEVNDGVFCEIEDFFICDRNSLIKVNIPANDKTYINGKAGIISINFDDCNLMGKSCLVNGGNIQEIFLKNISYVPNIFLGSNLIKQNTETLITEIREYDNPININFILFEEIIKPEIDNISPPPLPIFELLKGLMVVAGKIGTLLTFVTNSSKIENQKYIKIDQIDQLNILLINIISNTGSSVKSIDILTKIKQLKFKIDNCQYHYIKNKFNKKIDYITQKFQQNEEIIPDVTGNFTFVNESSLNANMYITNGIINSESSLDNIDLFQNSQSDLKSSYTSILNTKSFDNNGSIFYQGILINTNYTHTLHDGHIFIIDASKNDININIPGNVIEDRKFIYKRIDNSCNKVFIVSDVLIDDKCNKIKVKYLNKVKLFGYGEKLWII